MTDTTQTPDDEFSAAFAEASKPAAAPSSTPAAAAAPSGTETGAAASPSASAPSGTEPAAAAAAPSGDAANPPSAASGAATPAASAEASTTTAAQPAATPAADAPAPTPAPAAQPDYAAQIAALTAQLEELKKAPAPTPAPAAAAPAPTPAPIYSDDEKKIVEDYLKEWPDMARGEALLRRAEYQQIVGYVFETLRPRLEALESGYQTSSTRTQYQDLVALVPDYDEVRDKTLAWIETQPAYLKAAYQQVANEGSAKDVADLINRFKKETNYAAAAAPAPTPAPAQASGAVAPAAAAPAGGLAPAAAAAAASLRVVKTVRSEPVTAPDMNDFDAAFKEFASAG